MSDGSRIEWTDATWNPVTGCTKVSEGCKHCYAERMATRFQGDFKVRLHPDRLDKPLHWKRPRRIFVNSMSDLFHKDVPDEFIDMVFAIMALCPQHQFQLLTKRPDRMLKWAAYNEHFRLRPCRICESAIDHFGLQEEYPGALDDWPEWPLPHVFLGVSVEDQKTADERIPILLRCPAAVRFVSVEPMLEPVGLTPYLSRKFGDFVRSPKTEGELHCYPESATARTAGLDWVIVGGESGPGARPMHPDWVRDVRDQCVAAGVPFFFKQWGAWAEREGGYTAWPAEDSGKLVGPMACSCSTCRKDVGKQSYHLYPTGLPIVDGTCAGKFTRIQWVGKKRAGRLLDGATWDEIPGDKGRTR